MFTEYCDYIGIKHLRISTAHPRANGQAERMVRIFKETLTRILEGSKNGKWWELL